MPAAGRGRARGRLRRLPRGASRCASSPGSTPTRPSSAPCARSSSREGRRRHPGADELRAPARQDADAARRPAGARLCCSSASSTPRSLTSSSWPPRPRPSDDPVAEFCEQAGVAVHRGSLEDVASRVLDAARAHDLDAFVRINGDSPLLDQRLVDRAVAQFRAGEASIVTNVAPRSFPRGQSVEVISTAALSETLADVTSAEDREHVSPALYRRGDELAIENISAHGDYNHLHLTLDTEADRDMIEAILAAMDRPHWEYRGRRLLKLREAARRDDAARGRDRPRRGRAAHRRLRGAPVLRGRRHLRPRPGAPRRGGGAPPRAAHDHRPDRDPHGRRRRRRLGRLLGRRALRADPRSPSSAASTSSPRSRWSCTRRRPRR